MLRAKLAGATVFATVLLIVSRRRVPHPFAVFAKGMEVASTPNCRAMRLAAEPP